jgi:hypothetical protein
LQLPICTLQSSRWAIAQRRKSRKIANCELQSAKCELLSRLVATEFFAGSDGSVAIYSALFGEIRRLFRTFRPD